MTYVVLLYNSLICKDLRQLKALGIRRLALGRAISCYKLLILKDLDAICVNFDTKGVQYIYRDGMAFKTIIAK